MSPLTMKCPCCRRDTFTVDPEGRFSCPNCTGESIVDVIRCLPRERKRLVRTFPPRLGFDTEFQKVGKGQNEIVAYSFSWVWGPWRNIGDVIVVPPGQRLKFKEFLQLTFDFADAKGIIDKYDPPPVLNLVGHWTTADLPAFKDFAKYQRKLDSVRKSFVSCKAPLEIGFPDRHKHIKKVEIRIRDTLLLAAEGGKSLEKLGKDLGLEKLKPGNDANGRPWIEQARAWSQAEPAAFYDYALRDAEIAALYDEKVTALLTDGNLTERQPITLGGAAVNHLLSLWAARNISADEVLGYERKIKSVYNTRLGKMVTKPERAKMDWLVIHESLMKECYHGGRNEAYFYGPTWEDDWCEMDLTSAYPTALGTVAPPSYSRIYASTSLDEYGPGTMGFACVNFQYPRDTRFPGLPVRCGERGLIFPLEGQSFATSPEIAAARNAGADLEIRHGIIVPPINFTSPFAEYTLDLMAKRELAKKDGNEVAANLFKTMSNALIGKMGQGLKGKRAFSSREMQHIDTPECTITCAPIAAHTLGLVRALIAEILAGLPEDVEVLSATTDSIFANTSVDQLRLDGPIAELFRNSAIKLRGNPEIVGNKGRYRQMLPLRTRLTVTLDKGDERKPKLAKGGMQARLPREARDQSDYLDQENDAFVQKALNRVGGEKWECDQFRSIADICLNGGDLTAAPMEKAEHFEPDWKRELERVDVGHVQHISARSRPWRNADEFKACRDVFDDYRLRRKRILRTEFDWKAWVDYQAGTSASKAGTTRRGGTQGQILRVFSQAYVDRLWGLPGDDFAGLVEWCETLGVPLTVDMLKHAGRRERKRSISLETMPTDADSLAVLDKFGGKFRGFGAFHVLMATPAKAA